MLKLSATLVSVTQTERPQCVNRRGKSPPTCI